MKVEQCQADYFCVRSGATEPDKTACICGTHGGITDGPAKSLQAYRTHTASMWLRSSKETGTGSLRSSKPAHASICWPNSPHLCWERQRRRHLLLKAVALQEARCVARPLTGRQRFYPAQPLQQELLTRGLRHRCSQRTASHGCSGRATCKLNFVKVLQAHHAE